MFTSTRLNIHKPAPRYSAATDVRALCGARQSQDFRETNSNIQPRYCYFVSHVTGRAECGHGQLAAGACSANIRPSSGGVAPAGPETRRLMNEKGREREGERERETDRERQREREAHSGRGKTSMASPAPLHRVAPPLIPTVLSPPPHLLEKVFVTCPEQMRTRVRGDA